MRILLIVFLFASSFVSAQQTNQQKYLLDLSAKKFRWMVEMQLDSLSQLLDKNMLYIHSNGLIQTKEEMIKDFKLGSLLLDSVKIMEADVRMFDSTAIITGKGVFSGTLKTTPFQTTLLYTEVYINGNNRWKLVTRHANKLQ
jgi:hypothetical protein